MKGTLIYSGGSDSYTLLHFMRAGDIEVEAVSFNYYQRHYRELTYARAECERLGVKRTVLEIPFLNTLSKKSALTSAVPVPEGNYTDESMKQTVVPNRNMIMLSIAAAYALNNDCDVLSYGAHAGDHDIYPDCRTTFIQHMADALNVCDWRKLQLFVPFAGMDKRAIYSWGLQHGLNYAHAWSCYKGDERACGRCGACVERLHAFHDIGERDPMAYSDSEYWRTVVNVKDKA